MPFIKAADAAAVPPDTVIEANIGGNSYAICNVGGELRAFDGICPHAGGPLGEGNLVDGNLVCPWHAWEYDCSNRRQHVRRLCVRSPRFQ